MVVSKEVPDEVMMSYKEPDEFTGPDGLIKELKNRDRARRAGGDYRSDEG